MLLISINNPGIIILLLLLFFGSIALLVFLLRMIIPGLKEKGGKVSEEVAVKEELERVLEPIEDKKTIEEMEKFESENKK